MQSFDLSIKNYEIDSNLESSQNGRHRRSQNQGVDSNGFFQTPDLFNNIDGESGLITSDSDFEMEEKAAGHAQVLLPMQPNTVSDGFMQRPPVNIKKDVTRTFKKMLTANHNRMNTSQ